MRRLTMRKDKTTKFLVYLIVITMAFLTTSKEGYGVNHLIYSKHNAFNPDTSINIGQKVPDLLFFNVINYKDSTVRLSDLHGKAVIIDFWATWCLPCVKMLPLLEEIQRNHPDDLQIISVTTEQANRIESFFERMKQSNNKESKISFISATEYKGKKSNLYLKRYFPHNIVPHYVWIDRNGIVRAITGSEEMTEANIQSFLNGQNLNLNQKVDSVSTRIVETGNMNGDIAAQLIGSRKQVGFDNIKYQSTITGYIKGLRSKASLNYNGTLYYNRRLTAFNLLPITLYGIAYADDLFDIYIPPVRIINELSNNKRELFTTNYVDSLVYCYDLILPFADSTRNVLFRTMQQDLSRFFRVKGVVERRSLLSYAIVIADSTKLSKKQGIPEFRFDMFGYNGQNQKIDKFVEALRRFHESGKINGSIIANETGLTENIDINIVARMDNLDEVSRKLESFGLKLVKKKSMVTVLALYDEI